MKKAKSVARVHTHTHTHTSNSLENKQAKKLALLSISKADYKHKSV